MKEFIFTFGIGIDEPNRSGYHVVQAPDKGRAREIMVERFGLKWAFQYSSRDDAGVNEFNLREIKKPKTKG